MAWDGKERRSAPRLTLSEEQLEEIAKRAAEHALANFYREVGMVTVRSALYICGATILSALAWLGISGKIKL